MTYRATDDQYGRALDDLKALSANAADFAAGIKRCITRAAASASGECEQHRHGRADWTAQRCPVRSAVGSACVYPAYHGGRCSAGGGVLI